MLTQTDRTKLILASVRARHRADSARPDCRIGFRPERGKREAKRFGAGVVKTQEQAR